MVDFCSGVRDVRDSPDISQRDFADFPRELDFGEDTQKIIKSVCTPFTFGTIASQRQGKIFPPVPLHSNDFKYNEADKNHNQIQAKKEENMNHNGKSLFVKLLLVVFTLIIINKSSYSRIILNRGDEAFDSPNPDGRSITIRSCIIDGAGYYMQAYSDILLFLQEIEWSNPESVNFDELKLRVNRAIDNMKYADGAYDKLIELANSAPYNPVFVEKLTAFDYRAFLQSRAAYGTAFIVTWLYLTAGDVRGLFTHIKAGTSQISGMLMDIKAALDMEKFPELPALWRLNQKTAEVMMNGQFAAEIFEKISGRQ